MKLVMNNPGTLTEGPVVNSTNKLKPEIIKMSANSKSFVTLKWLYLFSVLY